MGGGGGGRAEYPIRAPAGAALCVELAAVKLWSPRLARALLAVAGIYMPSPPIPAPVSGSVAVGCAPFVQEAHCLPRRTFPLRRGLIHSGWTCTYRLCRGCLEVGLLRVLQVCLTCKV